MSVRVGERAGLDGILRLAGTAGFDNVPRKPAIYLGAFESTLSEVTSAYTVLATLGTKRQPYLIERIDDANGETIYRAPHMTTQALDPGVCYLTNSALTKVMERGTAAGVKNEGFSKTCAGKTGTTNDYMDAWFIGYTSSLTCGVWVGLDQPKTIVSRGYGAALALPIWADIMAAAPSARYPAKGLPSPDTRRCEICSATNELATDGCSHSGCAYAIDLPESRIPKQACHLHQGRVLTETGKRPSSSGSGLLRSFRRFFGGD
jgi:penicillin-binding protein 1A